MDKGSVNRSVSSRYGLRRNIVPSKYFEDFCVEGVSLSKKKCLQTRNTGVNGDTSTSQASLPLSIFRGALAFPLKTPGHQPTLQNRDDGHCKSISEPDFPSTQERFEGTDSGSTQTQLCHLASSKEQADTAQAEHRGEGDLVLQEKSGVSEIPSKETLEIAAILLELGQHIHLQNTVPQTGSLPQETPLIQERNLEQQGISSPEVSAQPDSTSGHVGDCDSKGRRNKQAKPCRVVPSKKQDQDFKLLIVPPAALFCSPGLGGGLPGSISQILGIQETSIYSSTKTNDNGQQNDGEKFSPWDIDIPFEWPATPREKENMFFPHLPDSSYKAEAAERKSREADLQASLRQMEEPLEERYIKNAAVLPDLRQPAPGFIQSPCPSSSSGTLPQEEPLKIHGCSVEEYKSIYHSLVDPKLTTKAGHPCPYGLQMGRVIKQRLWEKFSCPSFVETEDADGRVWVTESYCSPTLKPHAPLIEVDISEEPMPAKPKRKRARH